MCGDSGSRVFFKAGTTGVVIETFIEYEKGGRGRSPTSVIDVQTRVDMAGDGHRTGGRKLGRGEGGVAAVG